MLAGPHITFWGLEECSLDIDRNENTMSTSHRTAKIVVFEMIINDHPNLFGVTKICSGRCRPSYKLVCRTFPVDIPKKLRWWDPAWLVENTNHLTVGSVVNPVAPPMLQLDLGCVSYKLHGVICLMNVECWTTFNHRDREFPNWCVASVQSVKLDLWQPLASMHLIPNKADLPNIVPDV